MQCKCPKCGSDLEITVAAVVTPTRPAFELTPSPSKPTKKPYFRTFTDVGAIRNALYNAGYHDIATAASVYNDARANDRRIKVAYVGKAFFDDRARYGKFCLALTNIFGDRLLKVGPHTATSYYGTSTCLVIVLK